MTDKSVLVTGASSGIGFSIAADLAARGYHVLAAMRAPDTKNAGAAKDLKAVDGRLDVVDIDVTNDASVADGVARALALAGKIDVLINCAGIMWLGVSEAFDIGQFDTVMQTNLYGPFRMLRAVLPGMRAQRSGLVISVTSIAGRMVTPGAALYASSKFALEALTEGMRYEVSGLGIDMVLVEPGPFATKLKANGVPPKDTHVMQDYGPLAEVQRTVPAKMATLLAAPGVTTDPQAVADTVREIVALPPGKRPLRSTVGLDMGVADLNRAAAPFQSAYLAAMGLSGTEHVAS